MYLNSDFYLPLSVEATLTKYIFFVDGDEVLTLPIFGSEPLILKLHRLIGYRSLPVLKPKGESLVISHRMFPKYDEIKPLPDLSLYIKDRELWHQRMWFPQTESDIQKTLDLIYHLPRETPDLVLSNIYTKVYVDVLRNMSNYKEELRSILLSLRENDGQGEN